MARGRAAARGVPLARARARAAAAALPRARRRARPLGRPGRRAARPPRRRRARARARGPLGARRAGRRCRSSSGAIRLRSSSPATSWARTSSCGSSRRAARERERVLAAADALRREVCGDEVTYVVTRNIQYTNVCYFRCGFCAFSKGKLAANLRGPAYLVPSEEIVRRAREAWERGATEVCLQGGIHPVVHRATTTRASCRRSRRPCPEMHVHAFSALEVWQGAATLGLDLETYLARLRDLGPRLAARHGRRDPRRRGARGHLPRQGDDRPVARGARRRAPRRPALERDDHVRPRRAAGHWARHLLRRARAAGARRAASPSSCRCRSCRWRRRSSSRGARGAGRRSARRCSCTPSRGSRSIR